MNDHRVVDPAVRSNDASAQDFWVTAAAILLASFGVTLLVFTFFYVRDLRLLREIPEAVWAFICGVPREDGIVLPVLVLMSTLSFIAAASVWGWRWLRRR